MRIGEVAGNLFAGRVDHRNSALHEPFQRRIAKTAAERIYLVDTFFLQGARQDLSTANFHQSVIPATRNPPEYSGYRWR